MKRLFEIVTDHIGESYVRSYAWADNATDAERLFRESFPGVEVMRVNPLFWQHAGSFVTNPSDNGWETSREVAAILALKLNERDAASQTVVTSTSVAVAPPGFETIRRYEIDPNTLEITDVPEDEETRKLRFAISDCEAYCRGVTRDNLQRDYFSTQQMEH